MHIRCPHCQNPMELVDNVELKDISCPSCGSNFSLANDSTVTDRSTVTRRIAHFELIEQVGLGGFGSVWKAHDTQLDRTVAVKLPRKDQLAPDEQEQFLREARAAAQLHHPNIVSIYEVGREGEAIYIVSDFIQGATLAEWLEVQRVAPHEAVKLLIAVCEAVQHAHERGVIHRDLKPGNILIDLEGRPHVTDFGLAKREQGEITMTVEGRILGTPAYMSPEQARGEGHHADRRSDIYSLGVILFQLLTSELPFRGNPRMLVVQILKDEPPSPKKLNHAISRDLETICLKCLEKVAARRYQTAQELGEDLNRCLHQEPIHARPISRFERGWRWCNRQPVVAGMAATLILSLTAGAAVSGYFAWNESVQREAAQQLADEKGRLAIENSRVATQLSSSLQSQKKATSRARLEALKLLFEQATWKSQAGDSDGSLHTLAHVLVALHEPDSNGERLISEEGAALFDNSIRAQLLGIAIGRGFPRQRLRHEQLVSSVSFSPDGSKLATASWDHTVRIWDITASQPVGDPLMHGDCVPGVAFSPDGTTLATACWDHTARLWDIASQKMLIEPLRHDDRVDWVAFSPDGKRLATACWNGDAQLWDVATGTRLGEPFRHTERVRHVSFSPDGVKLATAGGETGVRLWNLSSGQLLGQRAISPGGGTHQAAFSPDGLKLASVGWSDKAQLWDLSTGEAQDIPMMLENGAFVEGGVRAIAFSPDGTLIAAAEDHIVRLREIATGRLSGAPFSHTGNVLDITFSSDGTKLATACADNTAWIWDIATASPVGQSLHLGNPLTYESHVFGLSLSPDGAKLATASLDNTVIIWDIATGNRVGGPLIHDQSVEAVDFSPDGTKLATGCSDGIARIWDIASGLQLGQPLRHDGQVRSVAFSPDGSTLATARAYGAARLWKYATGELLGEPIGEDSNVNGVAFSPDGTILATAHADGIARLWSVATRKPIGKKFHNGVAIADVAFGPSGTILATSDGNMVRLWDVDTGKPIGDPFELGNLGIAFSPLGKKLAIAEASGGVQLWDVQNQLEESPGQVLHWVEEVTALQQDEDGELIPHLAPGEWKNGETRHLFVQPPRAYVDILQRRRGAHIARSLDRARKLLKVGNYFAALWHVDAWQASPINDHVPRRQADANWMRTRCLVELGRENESQLALRSAMVAEQAAPLEFDLERFTAVRDLGLKLQAKGRPTDAVACLELLVERSSAIADATTNALDAYNSACARSVLAGVLAGSPDGIERANILRDDAVTRLSDAMLRGAESLEHMQNDTDLDSIREHPDYAKLVEQLNRQAETVKQIDGFLPK